jgi:hypothetical protein
VQTIFWWRTPVELVHLEDREGDVRILEFILGRYVVRIERGSIWFRIVSNSGVYYQ